MTATTSGPDIVPAPRKSGRPALTSRADLLDAARDIGFTKLTVGRVTAAAGVKHSTLWRHVDGIGALRAALVDDVLDANPVPDRDDWRDQLTACADILRHVLALHPGMAQAIGRLEHEPEWIATARERGQTAATAAGIGLDDAQAGVNAVLHLALAEPGTVGWREIRQHCDGIAAGMGEQ